MRFLDSSVFLHAYLTPRRGLSPREAEVKERAKSILARVDLGAEEVLTTVVHVSEVANVVESRLGLQASFAILARILSLENVEVVGIEKGEYEMALSVADRYGVSVNDALAYIKMREYSVSEAYALDKHFKSLPGVRVVEG